RLVRRLADPISVRLVAVTCHRDVLPWLEPDWIVELGRSYVADTSPKRERGNCGSNQQQTVIHESTPNTLACASGWCARLIREPPQKPRLNLRVDRVPQSAWWRFAPFHYLSGSLAASATCYAAMWDRE